jgi:hypothetical protein
VEDASTRGQPLALALGKARLARPPRPECGGRRDLEPRALTGHRYCPDLAGRRARPAIGEPRESGVTELGDGRGLLLVLCGSVGGELDPVRPS